MKKLHKILYSLFGFFVCGLGHTGVRAGTMCGKFDHGTEFTKLKAIDGWTYYLYEGERPADINTSLGVCVNNQCITVSSDNFSAGCVEYSSVWALSLYEATPIQSTFGCTGGEAYTASGCIADSECSTGFAACESDLYHKTGCSAGCAEGFFYDSDASACTQCPTYSIAIAGKDGTVMVSDVSGSTASCNVTKNATINKCYASDVTNGRTKDGHSYTITNGACFYGSY